MTQKEMTLEDLFAKCSPTDRVMVKAPNGEEIFNNYIGIFPKQYLGSEVRHITFKVDAKHKGWKKNGFMPPHTSEDHSRYEFKDMDVRIFYIIQLKKVAIDQALIPKKDPNAYDWGLHQDAFDVKYAV